MIKNSAGSHTVEEFGSNGRMFNQHYLNVESNDNHPKNDWKATVVILKF